VNNINVNIALITSSTVDIELSEKPDYDVAKLKMILNNDVVEVDFLSRGMTIGINRVIRIKSDTVWEISANYINIYYLFYKDFYFEFYKDNTLIAKTSSFKVEPKGKKNLYGIVNKLLYDFNRLWELSGTVCTLFIQNPLASKCSYCWDFDLNQRVSSVCPYCDGGYINNYIMMDFKARRINTQTAQVTSEKGINIIEQATYTTFDRNNFLLEEIFFDNTTKEFFEIKNANTASIGGVRTSTSLNAQRLETSDVRVQKLLPLLAQKSSL